jgi:hypothetical protein
MTRDPQTVDFSESLDIAEGVKVGMQHLMQKDAETSGKCYLFGFV